MKVKIMVVTICSLGLSACATVESYVEQVLEAPVGAETVQTIYIENQVQEPYAEKSDQQPIAIVRTSTRVSEDQTFGIDRYDEEALDDYIEGLKGAVQFLTAMQTPDSPVIMQGMMLLGLVQGQIRTAKIEIEEWPIVARKKAWEVQGSRITKYNKLVEFEKERILFDQAYDAKFRRSVGSIALLTEESLLTE